MLLTIVLLDIFLIFGIILFLILIRKNDKKFGVVLQFIGRCFLVLLVTLSILLGTFYIVLQKCCNGPSEAARTLFITTILETGQLKFLANWVCTDEEIQDAMADNPSGQGDELTPLILIRPLS